MSAAAPRPEPASAPDLRPEPLSVTARGITKAFDASPVLRGVALDVEPGSLVALLGPSGCGKTTLLRILAGLERPDAGTVEVGDRLLTGPGTFVPPEQRRVGMVFQDWALFPHLSVARNVAYGLPRGQARRDRVEEALDLVGLSGLGDRMPGTLSGGQQQRVALARAIAPAPAVLLLDEPFSNLDTALRVQVRAELHHLLLDLGITTVFVTHDQEEAFVLGDEVAVMRAGVVEQQATPAELYRHPASRWVATFVGEANLISGTARGTRAETGLGSVPVEHPEPVADGDPVDVLFRPEHLTLDDPGVARAGGEVRLVEFYGHDTVYVVDLDDGGEVRVRAGAAPIWRRGDTVSVRYAGGAAMAYPRRRPDDAVADDGPAAAGAGTSGAGTGPAEVDPPAPAGV